MNIWTKKSFELANNSDYLDRLNSIYPTSNNVYRAVSSGEIKTIKQLFSNRKTNELLTKLFEMPTFPLSNSYVAYLRQDKTAIVRNPKIVNIISSEIYSMGIDTLIRECSKPIAPSRQIGPMFKNWLKTIKFTNIYYDERTFLSNLDNGFLIGSDAELKKFAAKHLGYNLDKGIDMIARFNNKYVIGEAKFLTATGGTQNNQFFSAVSLANQKFISNDKIVISIAIIDGVCYLKNSTKIYNYLNNSNDFIFSALLLEDFLKNL
jgi:hypothetical protein